MTTANTRRARVLLDDATLNLAMALEALGGPDLDLSPAELVRVLDKLRQTHQRYHDLVESLSECARRHLAGCPDETVTQAGDALGQASFNLMVAGDRLGQARAWLHGYCLLDPDAGEAARELPHPVQAAKCRHCGRRIEQSADRAGGAWLDEYGFSRCMKAAAGDIGKMDSPSIPGHEPMPTGLAGAPVQEGQS